MTFQPFQMVNPLRRFFPSGKLWSSPGWGGWPRWQWAGRETPPHVTRLSGQLTHPAKLLLVLLAAITALFGGALSASAQGGVPDVPNQPIGNAVFIAGVDLEWNDVPRADSYDVQLYRNGHWAESFTEIEMPMPVSVLKSHGYDVPLDIVRQYVKGIGSYEITLLDE